MSSKKAIATKTLRAKNDEDLLKELKTLRVKITLILGRITKYKIYQSCRNISSKNLKNKSKFYFKIKRL